MQSLYCVFTQIKTNGISGTEDEGGGKKVQMRLPSIARIISYTNLLEQSVMELA